MSDVLVLDSTQVASTYEFLQYDLMRNGPEVVTKLLEAYAPLLSLNYTSMPEDIFEQVSNTLYLFVTIFVHQLSTDQVLELTSSVQGRSIIEFIIKFTTPEGLPGPFDLINERVRSAILERTE